MVDIMLLLMATPSAISLLIVSPRDLQRKALLALREREEMELSPADGRGEDGQATAIPRNSRSGSHPLADVIRGWISDERTVCTKEKL
jgi:hypothetical protein